MSESVSVSDIPVVILCGGMGTRLREASGDKVPKPLVDIGGRPILWHIMKIYREHGFRKFILCLGYKGDQIKRYFLDYREHLADFTLRADDVAPQFHKTGNLEDWEITFVETGLLTGTGARIKRVAQYIDADHFALTYGDGIGDVDIPAILRTHIEGGRTGTVTGVHPASRYGEMHVKDGAVEEFNEKPTLATGWVSGGFFMFQRSFIDKYLDDDPSLLLEKAPLQQLARDGELSLYEHEGFWMGMDTYRDWTELNGLWDAGQAAWKIWED
jgi:glucose-1-phosphate cytidylyltransferase